MEVNGKHYPMWSQFVEKQKDFIGNVLEDFDCGMNLETVITGISLKSNGKDSAFFSIDGKDFNCGFDVKCGGITAGEDGYLTFSGYGGHVFRIKTHTF